MVEMKVRIPVALAGMGAGSLSTTEQARRMMAGLERYDRVLLDFRGVEQIGAHFAEHVFQGFNQRHPSVHIDYSNTTPGVELAIRRCLSEQRSAS